VWLREMYQPDIVEMLREMARDYDDIAKDFECGAIEMRYPELMLQRR